MATTTATQREVLKAVEPAAAERWHTALERARSHGLQAAYLGVLLSHDGGLVARYAVTSASRLNVAYRVTVETLGSETWIGCECPATGPVCMHAALVLHARQLLPATPDQAAVLALMRRDLDTERYALSLAIAGGDARGADVARRQVARVQNIIWRHCREIGVAE